MKWNQISLILIVCPPVVQSLKDDRPGSDEESDMGSASDGDSKEYLDTRDEPTMKKQKTTV